MQSDEFCMYIHVHIISVLLSLPYLFLTNAYNFYVHVVLMVLASREDIMSNLATANIFVASKQSVAVSTRMVVIGHQLLLCKMLQRHFTLCLVMLTLLHLTY